MSIAPYYRVIAPNNADSDGGLGTRAMNPLNLTNSQQWVLINLVSDSIYFLEDFTNRSPQDCGQSERNDQLLVGEDHLLSALSVMDGFNQSKARDSRAAMSEVPRMVCSISGARGTGKTTLLLQVRRMLNLMNNPVALEKQISDWDPTSVPSENAGSPKFYRRNYPNAASPIRETAWFAKLVGYTKNIQTVKDSRRPFLCLPVIFPENLSHTEDPLEHVLASLQILLEAKIKEVEKLNGTPGNRQQLARLKTLHETLVSKISVGWYGSKDITPAALARDSYNYKSLVHEISRIKQTSYDRDGIWRSFVDGLLQAFGYRYLCLFIDDTDNSNESDMESLQAIRTSLSHPRIITMYSSNMDVQRVDLFQEELHQLKKADIVGIDPAGPDLVSNWQVSASARVDSFLEKVLPPAFRHQIHVAPDDSKHILSGSIWDIVMRRYQQLTPLYTTLRLRIYARRAENSQEITAPWEKLLIQEFTGLVLFFNHYRRLQPLTPREISDFDYIFRTAILRFDEALARINETNQKHGTEPATGWDNPRLKQDDPEQDPANCSKEPINAYQASMDEFGPDPLTFFLQERSRNHRINKIFSEVFDGQQLIDWLRLQDVSSQWVGRRSITINGRILPEGTFAYTLIHFFFDRELASPVWGQREAQIHPQLLPHMKTNTNVPRQIDAKDDYLANSGISTLLTEQLVPCSVQYLSSMVRLPDNAFADNERDYSFSFWGYAKRSATFQTPSCRLLRSYFHDTVLQISSFPLTRDYRFNTGAKELLEIETEAPRNLTAGKGIGSAGTKEKFEFSLNSRLHPNSGGILEDVSRSFQALLTKAVIPEVLPQGEKAGQTVLDSYTNEVVDELYGRTLHQRNGPDEPFYSFVTRLSSKVDSATEPFVEDELDSIRTAAQRYARIVHDLRVAWYATMSFRGGESIETIDSEQLSMSYFKGVNRERNLRIDIVGAEFIINEIYKRRKQLDWPEINGDEITPDLSQKLKKKDPDSAAKLSKTTATTLVRLFAPLNTGSVAQKGTECIRTRDRFAYRLLNHRVLGPKYDLGLCTPDPWENLHQAASVADLGLRRLVRLTEQMASWPSQFGSASYRKYQTEEELKKEEHDLAAINNGFQLAPNGESTQKSPLKSTRGENASTVFRNCWPMIEPLLSQFKETKFSPDFKFSGLEDSGEFRDSCPNDQRALSSRSKANSGMDGSDELFDRVSCLLQEDADTGDGASTFRTSWRYGRFAPSWVSQETPRTRDGDVEDVRVRDAENLKEISRMTAAARNTIGYYAGLGPSLKSLIHLDLVSCLHGLGQKNPQNDIYREHIFNERFAMWRKVLRTMAYDIYRFSRVYFFHTFTSDLVSFLRENDDLSTLRSADAVGNYLPNLVETIQFLDRMCKESTNHETRDGGDRGKENHKELHTVGFHDTTRRYLFPQSDVYIRDRTQNFFGLGKPLFIPTDCEGDAPDQSKPQPISEDWVRKGLGKAARAGGLVRSRLDDDSYDPVSHSHGKLSSSLPDEFETGLLTSTFNYLRDASEYLRRIWDAGGPAFQACRDTVTGNGRGGSSSRTQDRQYRPSLKKQRPDLTRTGRGNSRKRPGAGRATKKLTGKAKSGRTYTAIRSQPS